MTNATTTRDEAANLSREARAQAISRYGYTAERFDAAAAMMGGNAGGAPAAWLDAAQRVLSCGWENSQPWPGDEFRGMSFPKAAERPAPYRQTDEEFAKTYNQTTEEALAQQADECAAEAGMDAYFTSTHNGAGPSASLALAHSASVQGGCSVDLDNDDNAPTQAQLDREQDQYDEHFRLGKYAEADARKEEADAAWSALHGI